MYTLKSKFIVLVIFAFMVSGYAQTEAENVKETCNRFINGRINLRANDSLELKAVASDSLFRLIMLHHKYEQMLKTRIIRADLRMRVKSVDINGDCASCEMTSIEYYKIHLCKDGDKNWRVKGENSIFPTEERITKAKNKIKNYNKQKRLKPRVDSILKVVNRFLPRVKDYFLTQNLDPLKSICDEATLRFIQNFYAYAKERSGIELLHDEMNKPNFMVGDYYDKNNLIEYKFYNEDISIVLTKNNKNNFIISGFNGNKSGAINEDLRKNYYLDFLRSMKLTRQARYRNKALN
ncbi:hypothetical protein [Winogradskyella sp. PG-2]|uniref:hypothetical protein n=1 Tax=Winogradskyella sp. PG-2 TaxID=754409 RepID=UPI00045866CC|nr:hypothetical protein [Winogradskyella sp. PG-2]BAO76860.1 hypothetical protein WPG_2630 [Winogradskyella sp. PG-2]